MNRLTFKFIDAVAASDQNKSSKLINLYCIHLLAMPSEQSKYAWETLTAIVGKEMAATIGTIAGLHAISLDVLRTMLEYNTKTIKTSRK